MPVSLGPLKIIRRFLLRTELNLLLKTGVVDVYQPIPWLGVQKSKRYESTLKRWEAINNELQSSGGSALDIGCNLGFFTFQMERKGFLCIGIESGTLPYHICNLAKEVGVFEHAVFLKGLFNENLSEKLPIVDVTICLSVFHHLVCQSGIQGATDLLVKLLRKTRKVLFFETGQSNEVAASWAKKLPAMTPNPKDWVSNYFLSIGATSVKYLGEFETHISPVKRCLFAVYPS